MKEAAFMTRPRTGSGVSPAAMELAPWFHNLHLPDGSQTAPEHPLGDFPACKWQQFGFRLPEDLRNWTVLDIGCNAGFYSIELARRGAQVTALDKDAHFLRQLEWAIREFKVDGQIRVQQGQVYDLAHSRERFDLVLFMGVFYHLRHPLLGLDIVAEKTKRLLVFQTLTMPGDEIDEARDLELDERDQMLGAGWPRMAFIEKALAGDETNWWAPNHAAVEALLRSSGMQSIERVAHEIYLCHPEPRRIPGTKTWDREELRSATGQLMGNPNLEPGTHGSDHPPWPPRGDCERTVE
jgi:tRNA (mo5U34)-methyltransferase